MLATLADVLADTAQNSIEAGAKNVTLTLEEADGRVTVTVADDGKGMDADTRRRAFDPFFSEPGKHDRRRVGLGLPMLRQLCENTGGGVTLESAPGRGTVLRYWMDAASVDLPPAGDLAGALLTLFNYPGGFEFTFRHRRGTGEWSVSRSELTEAAGSLEDAGALALAREFIGSQEAELPPAEGFFGRTAAAHGAGRVTSAESGLK